MNRKYSVNFNGKFVPLTENFLNEYRQILEKNGLINIFSCFINNDGTFAHIYSTEEREEFIDSLYDNDEYYDDYDDDYYYQIPVISQFQMKIRKDFYSMINLTPVQKMLLIK